MKGRNTNAAVVLADDDATTASTYSAAVFGAEDMTMAAMRIITSFEDRSTNGDMTAEAFYNESNTDKSSGSNSHSHGGDSSSSSGNNNLLYQEAMRFIVDEVSIRKSD